MRNIIKASTLVLLCSISSLLYAGATSTNDPLANSPCDSSDAEDCKSSSGMPIYLFKSMLAGLSLRDTPLSYVPPVGLPIEFELFYNAKDLEQDSANAGTSFGKMWTSNWFSYMQDNPQKVGDRVTRYVAGGGAFEYSGYQSSSGEFAAQHNNAAKLVRINSQSYELRKSDGSIERFAVAENKTTYPRKVYLSERIDPQGNSISIGYDAEMRIDTITDEIGQTSRFYYDNADFPFAVTRMADPFGRQATLEYDELGRLFAITDAIGMRSSFAYQGTGTFISSMTTPYGTTQFEETKGRFGNTSASIQAIDPLGHIERTEYRHSAPGLSHSESKVPSGMGMRNDYMNYRNSFYWDKTAFSEACSKVSNDANCDYQKAQIKHFLHNEKGQTARTLESIKKPLESRIWFNYQGQRNSIYTGNLGKPNQVGRVLDDGSTQRQQYQYNPQGNITLSIDPEGRETHYRYAENGIDLIQIQQKKSVGFDTLLEVAYNDKHLPINITDAAKQTTQISYNERGQRLAVINALGQTTRYQYNAKGYLIKIYNHANRVQQSFSYDDIGRIASATDSEGYTLHYQYDALNRLTSIRYPDNTERTLVWNKLDLARITDREGKTTTYEYDANRNLIQETDPLGYVLQYSYYPNGNLKTLTDKNGNTTTWLRDIQGRVIAKTYADYQGYKLRYDSAGRLIEKQDALGQHVLYGYNLANLLTEKRYENALNPTTNVQFAYDAIYPRPKKTTDVLGETIYQYHEVGQLGANQLKAIQGEQAWQNWQFNYDALGREVSQSVANTSITQQYDVLGRITNQNNILGQFSYQYLGDSQQVTQQKITNVPYQWQREYYGNSSDRQLKSVQYQQLETIRKQWPWPLNLVLPAPAPEIKTHSLLSYDFSYSAEGRLTERTTAAGEPSKAHHHLHFPILHWLFGMHHGHHTQPQTIDGTEQYSYDDNGRLTAVNKQRRATGDYYYDPMGNTTDMEESGFAYQQHYNELNQAQTHEYDLNGNLINDGQFTYNWDAENRLIRIQNHETNAVSEFVYDAYSRRVSENMTEANGQAHTVNNLWCGETLCAQANAQGQVTQRYFSQGEWHNGQAYFYAQDQIGSVTAMIDTQGKVAGTALYSPYGKLLQSEGVQANIAYAGLYHHKESGLYLATYRGYNPFTARWLNRDPIEENGGLNLYEYVGGSPLTFIDTIGLDVYIKSRDVIGLGGTGAHTFISIVDSDNKNTVYGSYKDSEGMNKVLKNVTSDYALAENKVTSQTLIKPPKGMSQKEWDDKVIQTGEYYLENQSQKYSLWGGDGGNESGNCHTTVKNIINTAGGVVPSNYNPPGLNPGL